MIDQPERALRWLPAHARPPIRPLPHIRRSFDFEDGDTDFGIGRLQATGALESRWCLRGVQLASGLTGVKNEGEDVLPFDPDLWIEAMCKTSQATVVTFKVWDKEKERSIQRSLPIEAHAWTPIAMPLRSLRTSSKSNAESVDVLAWPCRRLEILAGRSGDQEPVELLVDDVRFFVLPRPSRHP